MVLEDPTEPRRPEKYFGVECSIYLVILANLNSLTDLLTGSLHRIGDQNHKQRPIWHKPWFNKTVADCKESFRRSLAFQTKAMVKTTFSGGKGGRLRQ